MFDNLTSFIDWGLTKKVKLNLGLIGGVCLREIGGVCTELGNWPAPCPSSKGVAPCAVPNKLAEAFEAKQIRMDDVIANAHNAPLLQLFNHAYDHNQWFCYDGNTDHLCEKCQSTTCGYLSPVWANKDLDSSHTSLGNAFPGAEISTFVPPQNLVTTSLLAYASKQYSMRIISSQGTIRCNCNWAVSATGPCTTPQNACTTPQLSWDPPTTPCGPKEDNPTPFGPYNYLYAPCQAHDPKGVWAVKAAPGAPAESEFCIPPGDLYFKKASGFQTFGPGSMHSIPTGSANSYFREDGIGISPKESIGGWECGAQEVTGRDGRIDGTCSIIASATSNALRSDGIHWTVMMMHPQTKFPKGQGYASWMDDFYEASQKNEEFDFHFIHFSDLLDICYGDSFGLSVAQCAAWVKLFDATTGGNWKQCTKMRLDPCSCPDITCSADAITAINMPNNNMVGTLPPCLADLADLATFNVQGNQLSGALPELPGSLEACTLFLSATPTNHFACPLPAAAIAKCKKVDGSNIAASDCNSGPAHTSPLVIALCIFGGIAFLVLLNLQQTKRGPFRSASALATPLLGVYGTELEVPELEDTQGNPAVPADATLGGRMVPGDSGNGKRLTVQLRTSNARKYTVGQFVFGMGADQVSGIVASVVVTSAGGTPGGRQAGVLTVSVCETRVLDVDCLSRFRVKQRYEGEVRGVVAACAPSAPELKVLFKSDGAADLRRAESGALVGERVRVFDTGDEEVGRLGTVVSIKSSFGSSTLHLIKFDEGDGQPEPVLLNNKRNKGSRFHVLKELPMIGEGPGKLTIFVD
jgi:hypothetical protein